MAYKFRWGNSYVAIVRQNTLYKIIAQQSSLPGGQQAAYINSINYLR